MSLLLLKLADCRDVDLDLVADMKHERATRRIASESFVP